MVTKVNIANVRLWGMDVGAVAWEDQKQQATFEFTPTFVQAGLNIAPLLMPLEQAKRNSIFTFPALNKETYWGLPGLLADALPDKFGNKLIDTWLARKGRDINSFSPVERLCYIGNRAMGALEFSPSIKKQDEVVDVEIADLVVLAQEAMSSRDKLDVELKDNDHANAQAMRDILLVGTSAGGARPKAVIAVNNKGRVLSGQSNVPEGFEHWIIKFDGVDDLELGAPKGYGRIEYAYYLMAKSAGVTIMESHLKEEHGRAHFMTKRFDRNGNKKIHMQTLCGIAHYDFNMPGAYGYEQAFEVMRRLRLSKEQIVQLYRRMIFNVLARNQDDHTKNISFLMNEKGEWSLAPAYDVTYSHNPHGRWSNQHQMTLNGKRDNFTKSDLITVGKSADIPRPEDILHEVIDAVSDWERYALSAGIKNEKMKEIADQHRKL